MTPGSDALRPARLLTGGWLLCCLILGGASAGGMLANLLLQLAALAILAWLAWRPDAAPFPREARWLMLLLALFVGWSVLTLIPLPPEIWTRLPGREPLVQGYRLLGVTPPWMSIALEPQRLVRSLLAVLPPLATFLLVRRADERSRYAMVVMLLALALLSIMLGALQLGGGPDSPLRPYTITNRTAPVGLFANANHLATLLLVALPFAAVAARAPQRRGQQQAWDARPMLLFATLTVVLAIGLAINRSLAGIALMVPVVVASIVTFAAASSGRIDRRLLAGGAIVIVAALSVGYGIVSSDLLASKLRHVAGSRALATPATLGAAVDFMPFGSGLGSFVDVYGLYEPRAYLTNQFMNHAHNDYAELALELGAVGISLALAFALWFARCAWGAWARPFDDGATARAASVAIVAMLAHSLADYPLRTAAMASFFAAACALLVPRSPAKPFPVSERRPRVRP